MKVLLVTGSFPPMRCGVGDYTWKLATALTEAGITVGVLTGEDAAAIEAPGDVTVFPVMPDWRLSSIGKANKVIRTWKPDVVHVQYPTQGYDPGAALPSLIPWLASFHKIGIVRTWHEIPSGREKSFLLQASPRGEFIVTRQSFSDTLPGLAKALLHRSRCHYIPIGSNISAVDLTNDERLSLRNRYLDNDSKSRRIIAYFGFLYRFKGADQLFDICNPATDHLIFIGDMTVDDSYTAEIAERAETPPWQGHATLLGYLPENDIARHLALADGVVLPFRRGGGIGNGTIHAAVLQGTPVVTTSRERVGYDSIQNVFYAPPDNIDSMRDAVDNLVGQRRPASTNVDDRQWHEIAIEHRKVYDKAIARLSK
ncbi:conserved hypothetical protein [Sphingomonas sp. T1]|uniref:glycosyltransferase family 4 protein n=1 Tax=Sphingomonas sp. T1 TaxID=2653172 RepID=UPI0012F1E027|nr:glycosyltransferase family 4 protein [Sphingomonas sp. T1]VXD00808.1 conserved hypothetical protein [Sphingomonas sp. T1]